VATQPDSTVRVVPRHVYDNRRNTTNVQVPKGFDPVWEDDRLNPRRTERTLAPFEPRAVNPVPKGYQTAWGDDRLNPNRGARTQAGDAAMAQVWTNTLPRRLVRVPTDAQVVRVARAKPVQVPRARAATRAKPEPKAGAARYVRVATYDSDASARASAKALARATGLPIRLGTVKRKGKAYRMVLAGPYVSAGEAQSAVSLLRNAGFPNARWGR